jgi:hypothetical protein
MNDRGERRPPRARNLSNNLLIAALVTGAFTLLAAFIGGARVGPGIGISPQPTATVTITTGPTPHASSVRVHSPIPGTNTSGSTGKIYLSTLKPVESEYATVVAGPTQFGAKTYSDSIRFTCEGGQSSVAYSVAGFKFLDATIDVPDDANNAAGNTATITFLKNGATQLGQPITDVIGKPQAIHLNLQGAAQLEIACTATANTSGSYISMDVSLGNASIGAS